jgi:AcrR family transcriptional regulator
MARRTGRPRLAPLTAPGLDPAEEISIAASRLFAVKGFASTTTREIAQAAGIQQPSLYYWFPTKLDILDRIVSSVVADSAAFAGLMAHSCEPALVRLYALVLRDTRQLCASPYDLSFLPNAPELREERLTYRSDLRTLHRVLEALIVAAIADGELVEIDPVLARRMILTTTSMAMDHRLDAARVEPTVRTIVRIVMRGLAAPGVDLDQTETAAQALSNP